jgi:putative SOS response-associated peptidase YedK
MCGRFSLTDPDPRLIKQRFGLGDIGELQLQARFNIAPTDAVLAVRRNREGRREAGMLRWGLIPHYADPDSWDRLLINARVETIAETPAFRDAFMGGYRCLIVADGFYEWRATEVGKQPVWISRPDRSLFAFAGLWSRAYREDESVIHSCTIVTGPPSSVVAPVHDRMPVILDRSAEPTWLDPTAGAEELLDLLAPTEELALTEVSDAVNDVRQDGPHLLEPPLQLF